MPSRQQVHHVRWAELRRSAEASHLDRAHCPGKRRKFPAMIFLNYLLAATDAHAKNYSIMLAADGSHRLAPTYDVASIAPYVERGEAEGQAAQARHVHRRREPRRPRFGKRPRQAGRAVRPRAIRHNRRGLPRLAGTLRQRIPGKLAQEFDALEKTGSADAG